MAGRCSQMISLSYFEGIGAKFFLGKNVLFCAAPGSPYFRRPQLISWMEKNKGRLFITEQIQSEYLSTPGRVIPDYVKLVPSNIDPGIKSQCLTQLLDLFPPNLRDNARTDLLALLEAGKAIANV